MTDMSFDDITNKFRTFTRIYPFCSYTLHCIEPPQYTDILNAHNL